MFYKIGTISFDKHQLLLNQREPEFDIPSIRKEESPIYGLQAKAFKKFSSVKEQQNSLFTPTIPNILFNNVGNSLIKENSSAIQFNQDLFLNDNQNYIGNIGHIQGTLHDRRPNLSIDLEQIHSDYGNDPLLNIANYLQNQNFINIYSSKNQNPPFSSMQYINEISSLNRTPIDDFNRFSPKL